MLPVDAFRNKIVQSIQEDGGQEELLDPIFLTVGPRAEEYINRITLEGAELVLDDILRDDSTEDHISAEMPSEETHDRLDVESHVIFWSKSGTEPFVGVYKKMNPNGSDVQRFSGETTMEPIREIDMEALEAHTHFMLKGIDEDTRGRVITDACKDCFGTEAAILNVQNIINDDVRLQGYALDEQEQTFMNEYRHGLRASFLRGASPDIVDESLYDEGLGFGSNDEIEDAENDIGDQRVQTADDELELAQMKVDAADELVNEVEVDLKVDAAAAPYFDAGPEKLAERIRAMPTGPIGAGSPFEKFVYGINKEGLNALGTAGEAGAAAPQPDMGIEDPTAMVDPTVAPQAPAPAAPIDSDLADL